MADVWAKPELGTGCVKITPAHDPNDYEVGLRQSLPMINILNLDGTLNEKAGPYRGPDGAGGPRERRGRPGEPRSAGRRSRTAQIDLAHSDRSKTPIEPLLTDQWFVRMERLAQTAMDAVIDGRVKIIPAALRQGLSRLAGREARLAHQPAALVGTPDSDLVLQDGHRRPTCRGRSPAATTWSGSRDEDNGQWLLCARRRTWPKTPCPATGSVREQDVLDTWFSSALWPHSTLGWPEQTPELTYYYPTNVLITSRDIITLWVARMVLTGLYNVGEVPFHDVFIHPKILDGYGEGMSKSKGNGVDPVDVMEKFGADSLRFGLAYLTTETQDIRMPVEFECPHCEGLIEQTQGEPRPPADEVQAVRQGVFHAMGREAGRQGPAARGGGERPLRAGAELLQQAVERLAVRADEPGRLCARRSGRRGTGGRGSLDSQPAGSTVTAASDRGLGRVPLCRRGAALYGFAWDEFCSFYLEMVKSRLGDAASRPAAQRVLAHTLDTLLRLLHPMTPFVTEEVWQLLAAAAPARGIDCAATAAESVMIAPWPQSDPRRRNERIEAQFGRFQEVLRAVRDIRSRQNVPPRTQIDFAVRCDDATAALLQPMEAYFASMAAARPPAWGPGVAAPALSATSPCRAWKSSSIWAT